MSAVRTGRIARRCAIGLAVVAAAVTGGVVAATGAPSSDETVFVPTVPCRLVDTRDGSTNIGPRSTPIGEGESVPFSAWATGDADSPCEIPTTARALATNTTAVRPSRSTYLTMYPADEATVPMSSNLNVRPGTTPTANAVTTRLSDEGAFAVYNRTGDVDVIVDVVGYFQPSSAVGAPGPQGEPGVSGYEIVEERIVLGEEGSSDDLRVDCPDGKRVLGGGQGSADGFKQIDVWRSQRFGASWFYTYTVLAGGEGRTVSFDVVCATVTD